MHTTSKRVPLALLSALLVGGLLAASPSRAAVTPAGDAIAEAEARAHRAESWHRLGRASGHDLGAHERALEAWSAALGAQRVSLADT